MVAEARRAWEWEQRRCRIVDIAEAVFSQSGFEAATMDRIAASAGYTKRTLYTYFKDKEALFLAVAARGFTRLNEMLSDADAAAGPQGDRLEALARAFFRFSMDHPGDADLVMRYEARYADYGIAGQHAEAAAADDLRAACQRLTDDNARLVLSVIEDGIRRGWLRTAMSPHQLMLVLWGQIYGVLHILRMRQAGFEAAFGISQEALFDGFVGMVKTALNAA